MQKNPNLSKDGMRLSPTGQSFGNCVGLKKMQSASYVGCGGILRLYRRMNSKIAVRVFTGFPKVLWGYIITNCSVKISVVMSVLTRNVLVIGIIVRMLMQAKNIMMHFNVAAHFGKMQNPA